MTSNLLIFHLHNAESTIIFRAYVGNIPSKMIVSNWLVRVGG